MAVSPIRPRTWARLYEIRTNRPIYGDRDGSVHYHLSEISEERRLGYEWQGSFTEVLRALERERILYEYDVEALRDFDRWGQLPRRLSPEEWAKVANLIDQIQTDGRWADGGILATATFVENCKLLSDAVVDLKLTAGR